MKKRIFSALIAVVMLLAMVPAIEVASAEAAIVWPEVGQEVTIGGKTYTYEGETEGGLVLYPDDSAGAVAFSAGDGYILWDNESTLTLHNATLTEVLTDDDVSVVLGVSLCTIVLEGKNKIEASASSLVFAGLFLLDVEGGVYYTIQGPGSLEIDLEHTGDPAKEDTSYSGYGICSYDDLMIDGAEISISVKGVNVNRTMGVDVDYGLTLKDAKLVCNIDGDGYTRAVRVDEDLVATGSAILGSSVSTDDGTDEDSYGYIDFIECGGDISLTKTVVKAELDAVIEAYGLYSESEILLDQSAVILTYPGSYDGINCSIYGRNVTFNESYVNVGGVIDTGGNGYYDGDLDMWVSVPGVLTLENTVLLRPADAYIYGGYEDPEEGWLDENDYIAIDVEDEGEYYPGYATGIMLAPKKFADVPNGAWFEPAVGFADAMGLFDGTGATTFSPDETMTRAMLATVLYSMAGKPTVSGSHGFNDVKASDWYANAVTWASQNSIVSGKGNGKFAPNDPVTRAEFVTMLYAYAKYCGQDVSASADLSGFADFEDIPDWAMDRLEWAVAKGLMSGNLINNVLKIDPNGNATRAQGAVIMQQFSIME